MSDSQASQRAETTKQYWLPIFPLKTSPPPRDTHLSWAKKVMFNTAKTGNLGIGPCQTGVKNEKPKNAKNAHRAPRLFRGGVKACCAPGRIELRFEGPADGEVVLLLIELSKQYARGPTMVATRAGWLGLKSQGYNLFIPLPPNIEPVEGYLEDEQFPSWGYPMSIAMFLGGRVDPFGTWCRNKVPKRRPYFSQNLQLNSAR